MRRFRPSGRTILILVLALSLLGNALAIGAGLRLYRLRVHLLGEEAYSSIQSPEVRQALLDFQRAFAAQPSGAVLDGRDIGTVICPDADVKLFVTASDAVRAQRRHAELVKTNPAITLEEVAGDLARRDARDAQRADAPLKPADDALLLDTTELTIDAAIAEAAALITRKREG